MAFERVDSIILSPSAQAYCCDVLGANMFVPDYGFPLDISKISLSPFIQAGSFTSPMLDFYSEACVVDQNGFLYVADSFYLNQILKFNVNTMARVSKLTLSAGEGPIRALVVDNQNGFLYAVIATIPSIIVKIDLSTFTRVGAITLSSGENAARSAAIDVVNQLMYVGCYVASPSLIVKIDLSTFTRVGAVSYTGVQGPYALLIDTDNQLLYTGNYSIPGSVSKFDLTSFLFLSTISLGAGNDRAFSLCGDLANNLLYVGCCNSAGVPASICKIDLLTFTFSQSLSLLAGEECVFSSLKEVVGGYAFFVCAVSPAIVVRINVEQPSQPSQLMLVGVG